MSVRSVASPVWIALVVGLASAPLQVAGAAGRKCIAEDGRILFTDQDCPAGTRIGKTGDGSVIQIQPRPGPRPDARDPHPRPAPAESEATPQSAADSLLRAVPLVGQVILASRFARALADLSNLKIHSMAYMAETGEWPTEPAQLGLDTATLHTADIVEIGYRRDGGIVAYLAPVFGHARWLWMQPHDALGGASIAWQCRTNVETGTLLASAFGGCERFAPPAAPAP